MRTIDFTHNGTKYSLGFTLDTVRNLEQSGFVLDEVATKPAIRVGELFYGSFAANHRGIKRKTVDEIWKTLKNRDKLIVTLAELYSEALDTMISGDEEDGEGNEEWTVTQ